MMREILKESEQAWSRGYKKLFSCSAQLSLKFILLINVKIVGILTFISRINYRLKGLEPEFSSDLGYFSLYELLKFHAQLRSMEKVL